RRHLGQGHLRLREVGSDDRGLGRVEVAWRAIGRDALDMQGRLAAVRVEPSLDPVRLLAGERPGDELAEEPAEARPADPVLRPTPGRVRRPGDRPTKPELPLGEERIVAGRHQYRLGRRLGGRAVVAQEVRETVRNAPEDRRIAGLDRVELLLDDLLA